MLTTVARFFQDGGPMMWVILGVMALALAVIVERLVFYFRTAADNSDSLVTRTARQVAENEIQVSLQELGEAGGPTRRLIRRALELAWEGDGSEDIRQGVEELAMREMPRFGRRLNYLAMLANVATLAGLLGTIFGLQQSFGSMVAMPCLAVHSRLDSLAARRTEDCDAAVIKLLNFFDARDRQRSSCVRRAAV